MSDMSERLRTGARMLPTTILDQAAAEIERLNERIAELESNESSIISLLESLETTLCTGEYNDRVANALALIAEIMALANSEVET